MKMALVLEFNVFMDLEKKERKSELRDKRTRWVNINFLSKQERRHSGDCVVVKGVALLWWCLGAF